MRTVAAHLWSSIRTTVHRLLKALINAQALVVSIQSFPLLDDPIPHEPVAVGVDTHATVLLGRNDTRLNIQGIHGESKSSRSPGRHKPAANVVRTLHHRNLRQGLPLLLELLNKTTGHVHAGSTATYDHQVVYLVLGRKIPR